MSEHYELLDYICKESGLLCISDLRFTKSWMYVVETMISNNSIKEYDLVEWEKYFRYVNGENILNEIDELFSKVKAML